MGTNSAIEWTDTTWNPLAGCTWASPGCDHCYAAVMARRLEAMALADLAAGRDPGQKRKYIGITNKNKAGRVMFNGKVNLDETAIDDPLRWKRPRRVFVNSMSDLFHKDVPYTFIRKVWRNMLATPQHTYQVLTKRPERMANVVTQLVQEDWDAGLPKASNIWLGTSVENQEQADTRIPHLLRVPASVRFLSCEPLLGPVDLTRVGFTGDTTYQLDVLKGRYHYGNPEHSTDFCFGMSSMGPIHWVIAGGESGHGARPMHPDWARSLRDQCEAGDVAFFFKQWGEYKPISEMDEAEYDALYIPPRDVSSQALPRCRVETTSVQWHDGNPGYVRVQGGKPGYLCFRVGKHAAGRRLDGKEYNELPIGGC